MAQEMVRHTKECVGARLALLALTFLLQSGVPATAQGVTPPGAGATSSTRSMTAAAERRRQLNKQTAEAVNTIPGVKVQAQDLEPRELPEIRGFHPIKRALRPIENMQNMAIRLQQQIMRLEGPIAALQPSMLSLRSRMVDVEKQMGEVDSHLGRVREQVGGVDNQMAAVHKEIAAVRADLATVHRELNRLREPMELLRKPLVGVAEPLTGMQRRLDQVQALLASVLAAMFLATITVAVGTPVAALLIYRNRKKLFPGLRDEELKMSGKP